VRPKNSRQKSEDEGRENLLNLSSAQASLMARSGRPSHLEKLMLRTGGVKGHLKLETSWLTYNQGKGTLPGTSSKNFSKNRERDKIL